MEDKNRTDGGVDLDLLFRPRSLAIIGVSKDPTKGGGFIWGTVKKHGYPGKKYPIGRSGNEYDGVPIYRSVSEVAEPVGWRRARSLLPTGSGYELCGS